MDHISNFIWLMKQASDGLFYGWPITIGLLVFTLYVFASAIKQKREAFIKILKFLPLPLVGTVLILISGIAFEEEPKYTFVVHTAFWATVLIAVILVYKALDTRKVALATSLLIVWYSFWCWFVSGMSVTGDWL